MNILYIEDEPNDAQLVALYVNTTPHHLTIAANTQEARKAFADNPDLILVDVLLGAARDGYKLVRELHDQGCTRPIIAITALTTPRDVEECQAVGFDFVLHKPFTIEQLAAVIGRYAS
jgi:CheY-like chemotaxis protein